MRLLRIEIEGITSLKDKLVIDFEKDLEGEDLFAITGPTGSGKSTILNCISIALYYKSHKDLNPGDFVSLGAKRGRIVLDFEINGDRYTSIWECSLYGVRGTRLKDPKPIKEFYKNGTPLDTKLFSPEQVIGLDEDQFQKTVIINQGKFSDFITSPFKDRKILLEKIYTTENITSFPSFLNKEINKLNEEKALLESTLKGGLPLTEEQYKKNTQREAEINGISINQEEEKKYIELIFNNIKDVVENASKINESKRDILKVKSTLSEVTNELIECEGLYKKSEIDLENFEKHYKKTIPEIDSGIQLINKKEELTKRLNDLHNQINEDIATLDKETLRYEQLKSNLKEKQTKSEEIQSSLGRNYSRDQIQNLERIISALLLENSEIRNIETLISDVSKKLKISEENGLSLNKTIENLKQNSGLTDTDFDKSETQLNQRLTETEAGLRKTQLSKHKIENWLKEHSESKTLKSNFELEKDTLTKEIFNLEKSYQNLEKQLLLTDKEIMLNEGLMAVNKCLEMAHETGECPVCKNKELNGLDAMVSSLKNMNDLVTNKDSIENELKTEERKLTQKKIQIQNLETKISESNSKETLISDQISNEINELELKLVSIDTAAEGCLSKLLHLESEINSIKSEIKKISTFKTEFQLQEQALLSERQKYTDLKAELAKFETKKTSQLSKKNILLDELKNLTSVKIDWESDQSSEFLKKVRLSKELADEVAALMGLLSNIEEGIKRLQDFGKKLQTDLEALSASINSSEAQLTHIYKELGSSNLSEMKDKLENELKEHQNKKNLLQKKLHSIQLKNGQLVTQIQYKEENIESLENLVLKYIKNIESRELPNSPTEALIEIEAKTEKIASHESAHFEDWEIENISGFHDDVLSYHFHSVKEQLQALKEEAVEIRTLNNSYLSKVAEFQKISKEMSNIDSKLNSKLKVKDVIGRDEFTRYAISMIEEQLIMMTNKELEKLCDGRYVLFQQEKNKTKGPEFFIKDLWRSSSERPLQSLSGGETFMVSLAMALGLAEMARGQTEIDTFFIDEGFGTLDQDSLEEVLNILMSIRSRGKQIGIISHVKELTDRLPIRIQLQKNQLGESHLEISTF